MNIIDFFSSNKRGSDRGLINAGRQVIARVLELGTKGEKSFQQIVKRRRRKCIYQELHMSNLIITEQLLRNIKDNIDMKCNEVIQARS